MAGLFCSPEWILSLILFHRYPRLQLEIFVCSLPWVLFLWSVWGSRPSLAFATSPRHRSPVNTIWLLGRLGRLWGPEASTQRSPGKSPEALGLTARKNSRTDQTQGWAMQVGTLIQVRVYSRDVRAGKFMREKHLGFGSLFFIDSLLTRAWNIYSSGGDFLGSRVSPLFSLT